MQISSLKLPFEKAHMRFCYEDITGIFDFSLWYCFPVESQL